MAAITVNDKTTPALAMVLAACASGGDTVANSTGGVTIVVRNANASLTRTVTVKSYQANIPQGTAKTDLAVAIAATRVATIGPLEAGAWVNPATGNVELTYSDAAADLTIAAYKG